MNWRDLRNHSKKKTSPLGRRPGISRADFSRLQQAKKHCFQLICARELRAGKTKETRYMIYGGDVLLVDEMLARDLRWFSQYYDTLKGSIQRQLNGDAFLYFENLYHDLMAWKKAKRPSVSPLVHPYAVFDSMTSVTDSISARICETTGYSPLLDRYHSLAALAHELRCCVSSLRSALEEEDSIDHKTYGTLWTVKERFDKGRLRFFHSTLYELVADVHQ
ncbi:hypothetical protein PQX77_021163 [Marasmius sp. AFHP31]|nr:hypothetical protein PQX77_021163 [Marasmius sp. AFHP31]